MDDENGVTTMLPKGFVVYIAEYGGMSKEVHRKAL